MVTAFWWTIKIEDEVIKRLRYDYVEPGTEILTIADKAVVIDCEMEGLYRG